MVCATSALLVHGHLKGGSPRFVEFLSDVDLLLAIVLSRALLLYIIVRLLILRWVLPGIDFFL